MVSAEKAFAPGSSAFVRGACRLFCAREGNGDVGETESFRRNRLPVVSGWLIKIDRIMMNLQKGELYVFSGESADSEPVYAVFEECDSGCLYVNFLLSSRRFETEGCLPDAYVRARVATAEEKSDFEKALEMYRRRLMRIERCLSERGSGDVEDELNGLLSLEPEEMPCGLF